MVSGQIVELIKARLMLAQRLLEESDKLEGISGFKFDEEKWWLHPRHEREAVVIYLLLTCFDLLGQKNEYVTFDGWLNGKSKYKAERDQALQNLGQASHVDAAKALHEAYLKLYGVKGSFYQGILGLQTENKERFLNSISVSFNPEYGKYGPNTSTPSYEINDKELELEMKLKRIYQKRNTFTHKLIQYHSASTPMMSEFGGEDGSSWAARIEAGNVYYFGVSQEVDKHQSGGAYAYSFKNWPFVLFETLYAAIGVSFHRSEIDLRFQVHIRDDNGIRVENNIRHKLLKPLAEAIHLEGIKDK